MKVFVSIRTLILHYTYWVLSSHCTVRADSDFKHILSITSALITSGIIRRLVVGCSTPALLTCRDQTSEFLSFLLRLRTWSSLRSRSVGSCCWSDSGVLSASVTILFSGDQVLMTQGEGERACTGHEVEKWQTSALVWVFPALHPSCLASVCPLQLCDPFGSPSCAQPSAFAGPAGGGCVLTLLRCFWKFNPHAGRNEVLLLALALATLIKP